MKSLTITLVDADGNTGDTQGALAGETVTYGPMDWYGVIDTSETSEAAIAFEDGPAIGLSGDAWRELEGSGGLDGFIRLLALDQELAKKVKDLAESGGPYFQTIVTRDASESAVAFTVTDAESKILEEADNEGYLAWEINDNPASAYLGSGADDTEECDLSDIIDALLQPAIEASTAAARDQALVLVTALANVNLSNGASAAESLQDLVTQARGILGLT